MLTTAMITSNKTGAASSISAEQARALVEMGVAWPCSEKRFTWHTDLSPEQVDTVLEQAGLNECGFCGAKAMFTHPTKGGVHMQGIGEVRAVKLYSCDECMMLVTHMDEDLLLERLIERTVQSNRLLAPESVRHYGEDEVRRQVAPAAAQALAETLKAIAGSPVPLGGESGFVVIGDDGA